MRQALYRMYRPKSFDEVFGQEHIIPILQNQIKSGSVSHAYLFAGPRGTGKTSTAKLFAKALNKGSEIDTIELDAASNNSVDDIREIVDTVSLAPFQGQYKVYILDEAHMLSKSAFNALLKTLEEPPEHVIFILATTEPERIPPTVLSRTLRFDFVKITNDTIVKRLKIVLDSEEIPWDEEALYYIAQKSGGGLRDALSLLDKALSYGGLSTENVTIALGTVEADYHISLLRAIRNNEISETVKILEKIINSGTEPRVILLEIIEYLKNIILFRNGVIQEQNRLKEGSELLTDTCCAYIIEEISKTMGQMRSSPAPETHMLASMVTLAAADFDNIHLYRNIPQIIQDQLDQSKIEISRLKSQLVDLQSLLDNLDTYPQKPVDKHGFSVDNPPKRTNGAKNSPGDLSTGPEEKELKITKISEAKETALTKEELDNINWFKEISPELKKQLKAARRVHISSLLDMSQLKRFINNNLFFVYSQQNKAMCKAMLKAGPNEYIDPILSQLYKRPVITHYITEDQLEDIKEDPMGNLIEKINQHFPHVKLDIE